MRDRISQNPGKDAASSPFGRWMELCSAPVAWQLEPIVHIHRGNNFDAELVEFSFCAVVMAEILVFCGAGLAVRCLLKDIALAMHKTQRKRYYPAEKMRRQALAAERRRVRRRFTVNPPPAREELL